jgi:hypothetical protein
MRLEPCLYEFFHCSGFLAEVLEFGHDDHHATKRTAKPIPIAVAAKTSRIFSFIIILLTEFTTIMGRVTAVRMSRKVKLVLSAVEVLRLHVVDV